jgi:flagellar assembly factor FliW
VLASPEVFFSDYHPSVSADDVAALGVADEEEVMVLVIVTVTDGLADATANLLAPVVVSAERGLAMQVVLADLDLPLRAPLLSSAS